MDGGNYFFYKFACIPPCLNQGRNKKGKIIYEFYINFFPDVIDLFKFLSICSIFTINS